MRWSSCTDLMNISGKLSRRRTNKSDTMKDTTDTDFGSCTFPQGIDQYIGHNKESLQNPNNSCSMYHFRTIYMATDISGTPKCTDSSSILYHTYPHTRYLAKTLSRGRKCIYQRSMCIKGKIQNIAGKWSTMMCSNLCLSLGRSTCSGKKNCNCLGKGLLLYSWGSTKR